MKRWLLTSLTILSFCAVAYSAPVQLRNVPNVTTFNDVLVVDSSDVKKATNAVARSVLFSNSTTLTSFGAGPTYKGQPIGSVFANATTLRKIGAGGSGGIAVADVVASGPWVDVRAFANLSTAAVDPSTANKNIWVTTDQTTNNLTMPSNRRLVYKGGIITVNSGKTLNMNGTIPDAGDVQIFTGAGSVTNLPFAYGRWFGATGDGSTDDTAALNKLLSAARHIKILGGTYMVNAVATTNTAINGGLIFASNTLFEMSPDTTIKVIPNGSLYYNLILLPAGVSNITIRGGTLYGDRETHDYATAGTHEFGMGINGKSAEDVTIDGVYVTRMTGDSIQLFGTNSGGVYTPCRRWKITNCKLERARRNNISVVVATDWVIDGNQITEAGIDDGIHAGTDPKVGVDVEGGSNPWRGKITNNILKGNDAGAINVFNGNEVIVANNISDGYIDFQYSSNVLIANNELRNLADTTHSAIEQTVTSVSPSTSGAMLAIGSKYVINTRATLDFTTIGAADNNPGTYFIATGFGPLGTGDSVTRQIENVTIVGNTITGFKNGVYTTALTRKVTVGSNTMRSQTTNGIYVLGNSDVFSNNLYDQSIGIRADGVNINVKGNIIDTVSNRGIYALGASGSGLITENTILNHTNNINGAIDISAGTWTISGNTIKAGTTGPPNYAIINAVAGTNIIGNKIIGGTFELAAIRLTQRANVIGNEIHGVLAPYGIYSTTTNASSSIVSRNYLDMTSTTGNRYGIFFSGGGTGVEISNNEIRNSASTMTNSINTDANTTSRVVRNLTTSGTILTDATDTVAENLSY